LGVAVAPAERRPIEIPAVDADEHVVVVAGEPLAGQERSERLRDRRRSCLSQRFMRPWRMSQSGFGGFESCPVRIARLGANLAWPAKVRAKVAPMRVMRGEL
jgi:hypothetical protein